MKIGFIIICRYNSKRLPGKILRAINGKPVIEYIIERIETAVNRDHIIVATSNEASDNPIESYCLQNNINIFRGSLINVAERFLKCAKKYDLDYAARINGDNFFMDIESLKKMVEVTKTNKYDFISNLKGRTFPKGMSIEIVRSTYYETVYKNFSTQDHFEHVTQYLYQNNEGENFFYFTNSICPKAAGIQLAIDDVNDFRLAEKIINTFAEHHTKYGLSEIFQQYENLKSYES